jgi:hypothetical protein
MVGVGHYFLLENQQPRKFRLERQPNANPSPTKLRPNTDRMGLIRSRQTKSGRRRPQKSPREAGLFSGKAWYQAPTRIITTTAGSSM